MKLYHWGTSSYARHKAADDLVDKVIELSDKFMEVYIGKYGRSAIRRCTVSSVSLKQLNDDTVEDFLDHAIAFVSHDFEKVLNRDTDSDLFNIRDELLAELNRSRYLFTLH